MFDCHGQLQIAILSPGDPVAFVKLIHRDDHIPYWNIDIPKEVRDFVLKNLSLTPQQVVFQSPVRSGLLHYFWCNRTRTGLFFPEILGNRTKTGMDRLPMVTIKTATSFGPVFIRTGPKPEVTGCNWPGSMTSKCLLMHPPRQHLLSTA